MLLTLALLAALNTAPVTDSVPGTWQITGDVAGNAVKAICMIRQSGAALNGSCSDATNRPYPLTGEVKDGKVTFQYEIDYQGQPLTIVYSATFASAKELKGTIEVKPMGASGTFTATPAPAKP
jgi:hypothetical protein